MLCVWYVGFNSRVYFYIFVFVFCMKYIYSVDGLFLKCAKITVYPSAFLIIRSFVNKYFPHRVYLHNDCSLMIVEMI